MRSLRSIKRYAKKNNINLLKTVKIYAIVNLIIKILFLSTLHYKQNDFKKNE